MITRIKAIMEHYKENTNSLASNIGMAQSSVDSYIKGGRKVSLAFVEAILNHYPEVSAEWLLRGKGEMFVEQNNTQPTLSDAVSYQLNSMKQQIDTLLHHISRPCGDDETNNMT